MKEITTSRLAQLFDTRRRRPLRPRRSAALSRGHPLSSMFDRLLRKGCTYIEPVEVTRARYRPDRITAVGESAPASGAFFYHGDSAMLRYMQRATEAALGVGSGDFLDRFKTLGWFLDDLVLMPREPFVGT